MNVIESYNFLAKGSERTFEGLLNDTPDDNKRPNNYGSYLGSCPNHEKVYQNLKSFDIEEGFNSILLIKEIYEKSNIDYTRLQWKMF